MERKQLESKTLAELRQIAGHLQLSGYQKMKKAVLVDAIMGESDGDDADAGSDDAAAGETKERSKAGADDAAKADAAGATDDDAAGEDDRHRTRPSNRRRDERDGGSRSRGGDTGRTKDGPPPYDDQEVREGVLDLLPEGYGFLRVTSYLSGVRDVYVSQQYVRRFDLRRGDMVAGPIRRNKGKNDKFPALARVETVEGESVKEGSKQRPTFTDFVPVHPNDRLELVGEDADPDDPTTATLRVVEKVAPIGHGQRVLVSAPPQAGRTTLLRALANALANDDRHVMMVLVDERPEEVTDLERDSEAEVVAATFDRSAEEHTQAAELAVQRAMRRVERGEDVVLLLDSLTRLVRAYDIANNAGGRHVLGSVEAASVHPARQLFGAARQVDEGGSLTIVATCLTGTNATDDAIRDELSTIATCEVTLLDVPGEDRLWPVVDVTRSETRHVEQLVGDDEADAIDDLRAGFPADDPLGALEQVLKVIDA